MINILLKTYKWHQTLSFTRRKVSGIFLSLIHPPDVSHPSTNRNFHVMKRRGAHVAQLHRAQLARRCQTNNTRDKGSRRVSLVRGAEVTGLVSVPPSARPRYKEMWRAMDNNTSRQRSCTHALRDQWNCCHIFDLEHDSRAELCVHPEQVSCWFLKMWFWVVP